MPCTGDKGYRKIRLLGGYFSAIKIVIIRSELARARSVVLPVELELELIQTQMTQKPMLRAEVYARALRASQNRKEDSVQRAGSI